MNKVSKHPTTSLYSKNFPPREDIKPVVYLFAPPHKWNVLTPRYKTQNSWLRFYVPQKVVMLDNRGKQKIWGV